MAFTPITDRIEYGYCFCGCGNQTEVWKRSDKSRKRVKGIYKKYIYMHKLPPSFKGIKRTDEDRYKKSLAAKKRVVEGRHNSYKGGVSPIHVKLVNSFEYKSWRRKIFERDRFACVWCSIKGGWNKKLHKRVIITADHIKPKARFPELVFDLNNGRTLCVECHMKTDTYGGRTTFYGR